MAHHIGGPFSIPAINNYIPEKLKPWIIILFAIIFQFSSGIYLATSNAMVGATALLQEDILMAGYASLIGTSLTFTIMMRLKMRYTSKFSLIICASVIIICNIIVLFTNNIVVLIATCFIVGVFRMWATFECNSTIQLWLTPNRDMSVFFCYIYLLVQGCLVLSGITNMYVALFSNWEYMHLFVIGALLLVILLVILLFNNKRAMRPFPLFGIDWLGAFIWGLILLIINFILIYGDHYDWLSSKHIQTAFIFLIILLPIQLYRASFIRHPYIPLRVFKYKAVYMSLILYLIVDVFLAPSHLIEQIYFDNILQYDLIHLISVNWMGLSGIIAGVIFTYFFFAKKKHSYKATFLIGFVSLIIYQVIMYFILDYNTTKEMLVIPVFFRNFGYILIAITLITNLMKLPFVDFFQGISAQAFVSVAIGSAWGATVIHHLFNHTIGKNFMIISSSIDRVNYQALTTEPNTLVTMISEQSLMLTFKELYGILIIIGVICFILFMMYQYKAVPTKVFYPTINTIKKIIKGEFYRKLKNNIR